MVLVMAGFARSSSLLPKMWRSYSIGARVILTKILWGWPPHGVGYRYFLVREPGGAILLRQADLAIDERRPSLLYLGRHTDVAKGSLTVKKIIASQYLSLDGVLEDPVGMEGSGLGNWTGPYSRGAKGDAFKHAELFACESILLGRRTYDGFAAVWPTLDDEAGFAKQINAMPKYVVSTTLKTAEWNNSTIIDKDVVIRVKALKCGPGGDMLVYGSATLLHTLMRAGLVDQYNLMIYPTVLGRGIRLFPQDWNGSLILDECTEFDSGIVMLRYSVT